MTSWLLMAVALPVAVALVAMCLREPMRVALPLFAASIPFGQLLSIGDSSFGSASSVLGMLLGVGLALRLATAGRGTSRLSVSTPVWILFLGLSLLSLLWSVSRGATLQGVAVLGSLILIYVLVSLNRVDEDIVRRTENGLLYGGVAVVVYGLYQLVVLGGFPDDAGGSGVSADGRFGNDLLGPNLQALSLLLPLVIAIQRAFGRAERHRLLNALVATLMVWGIFMTGSRTGTLVAAISLLTMALGSPRQVRTPMLAAFAVTVAAGVLVWVYQPAGVATRSFESVTSSSGRLDIWTVGLAACEEHCYYGSGWGTFPQVYADTQASVPGARVLAGDQGSYQPHNLWLLAAIELGLPGLLLLLWGLAAAFLDAVRLPQELRGPPLSAIVGLSVGVFFLSSMEFKFFWIVLIMIALYRNLSDTRVPLSGRSDLTAVGRPGVRLGR